MDSRTNEERKVVKIPAQLQHQRAGVETIGGHVVGTDPGKNRVKSQTVGNDERRGGERKLSGD